MPLLYKEFAKYVNSVSLGCKRFVKSRSAETIVTPRDCEDQRGVSIAVVSNAAENSHNSILYTIRKYFRPPVGTLCDFYEVIRILFEFHKGKRISYVSNRYCVSLGFGTEPN